MAYCTLDDIKPDQLTETELIQLTDDDDAGVVDESVVTKAIADADAEIDGYCGQRYTVPFTTVPAMIRKLSVDIAVYNLFSRRQGAPEGRKTRYDAAIKFLERVADGKAVVTGVEGTTESAADRVSIESATRVFSRSNMEGF
jgi:phage gp36-like protein